MAKTLRTQRTEQLLSTRRLAELAGTSNKTIVQLENGRQTPTFATIEKISRALGVEPRAVVEFARAIDIRAGVTTGDETVDPRRTHVLCVSQASACLSLARQLVDLGRYGVTSMIDIPATVEQIACLRPDILVLDLDTGSPHPLELLKRMRLDAATAEVPIVATGHDREQVRKLAARLDSDDARTLFVARCGQDQHELIAEIERLADSPAPEYGATMANTLGK